MLFVNGLPEYVYKSNPSVLILSSSQKFAFIFSWWNNYRVLVSHLTPEEISLSFLILSFFLLIFMISQIVWWLILQLLILHGCYYPRYLKLCLFLLGFLTLARLNFFWKLITFCLNNLFCLTFCYLIQRKKISKLFVVNWITSLLPWSIFMWPFNILSIVPPFKISTFHFF